MNNLSDPIGAGSSLFLDSAPVIYFVEKHPDYFALLSPLLQGLMREI